MWVKRISTKGGARRLPRLLLIAEGHLRLRSAGTGVFIINTIKNTSKSLRIWALRRVFVFICFIVFSIIDSFT